MLKYLIIFAVFCLVSCSKYKTNMSNDVIPPEKMVELLVDVHKADAYITLKTVSDFQNYQKIQKKNAFYNSIYVKYNTNQAKFDKSLSYYVQNPELFKTVYQKVIEKLNEELEKEKKSK